MANQSKSGWHLDVSLTTGKWGRSKCTPTDTPVDLLMDGRLGVVRWNNLPDRLASVAAWV
jgi:hypothetical protein